MAVKDTIGTVAVLGAGVGVLHYTGLGGKIWAEIRDAMGFKDPLSPILDPITKPIEENIIKPVQEWKDEDVREHGWTTTSGFGKEGVAPPLSPEHLGQVYEDIIAKPLGDAYGSVAKALGDTFGGLKFW